MGVQTPTKLTPLSNMTIKTDEECKRMLSRIGFKLGVSPRKISELLLSADDKQDMREGRLSIDELEAHVQVWMDSGQQDMVG